MRKLTVGSLFSGIGGIDLGLERAGMEIRWHSEIDPYASRVLAKHWSDVPNHGDIAQIDFRRVEWVDVLAGGSPCQGISNAGHRLGMEDERSGLWSEYARAIDELRPGYALLENVAAMLVRGIDRVLGDLAEIGYDAEWGIVSACSVGAPHTRERLFVVAYPASKGRRQRRRCGPERQPLRNRLHRCSGAWAVLADDDPPGSSLVRVADGIPARVDRLRGLGNAVVPQIPELIGGWIIEHARATGYLRRAA